MVAVVAVALIDGTRWLIVFPPLIVLVVVWIGQAVDAHQRALRMGAEPGGELGVVLLLPLALTVLTLFWLLGGRHGSPTATLQEYIEDWMRNQPAAAADLYATPRAAPDVASEWATQTQLLVTRVTGAEQTYGADSGLDADDPYGSLRFGDPAAQPDGSVTIDVDLVRSERVETTVLGVIPTAGQETVVVARVMTIHLVEQRQPQLAWLPVGGVDSFVWKIGSVEQSAQ